MSLFRTIPTPGDFSPLFRLLDDYDVHRSTSSKCQNAPVQRSFTPRFDVRETKDAYHLDGDLPGTAQKDIDIEFSDPQTLVIKGRSEREYHSSSSSGDDQPQQKSTPVATVADAEDDTTEELEETKQQATKSQQADHKSKPRYWIRERTVGEFQRTFSFATRVDQDSVKASLNNGVLSVVVPKAAAPSVKKISIA